LVWASAEIKCLLNSAEHVNIAQSSDIVRTFLAKVHSYFRNPKSCWHAPHRCEQQSDLQDNIRSPARQVSCPAGRHFCPAGRHCCPAGQLCCPAGRHCCPAGRHCCPAGRHCCPAGQLRCPAGQHSCLAGQHSCPAGQHSCPAGQVHMSNVLNVSPGGSRPVRVGDFIISRTEEVQVGPYHNANRISNGKRTSHSKQCSHLGTRSKFGGHRRREARSEEASGGDARPK